MSDIGGYFAWVKLNGKARPIKYDKDRVGFHDSGDHKYTQYRQTLIGIEHPLTHYQYNDLTLDQLAFLYPCPQMPSDPKAKL